jgi:hypothetical protein
MKIRGYVFLTGFFLFLSACSKPVITVWSAYAEMEARFREAAEAEKLELVFVEIPGDFSPSQGFPPENPPAVFILDGTMLELWAESGMLSELDPFIQIESGRVPVYEYEGKSRAVFFNGGNGAFCYNRKIAEKYLGYSDPSLVQRELGDLNSFIVSAYRIGAASEDSCAVLPGTGMLAPVFEHTGKLSLQQLELAGDSRRRWLADTVELFHDRRWDGLLDEEGKRRELFSFFLPPLGFFAVPGTPAEPRQSGGAAPVSGIPPKAEWSAYDWTVIPGPDPLSRGGAWLALHKDFLTEKKTTLQKVQKYLGLLLQL